MAIVESTLGWIGTFLGGLGLLLLIAACIIALFKIDEADYYFGEWSAPEKKYFKGLPFSLSRMTYYGMAILFKRNQLVKRFYIKDKEHLIDEAPRKVKLILVWVYTSWISLGVSSAIVIYLKMLVEKI
ncbi:hypothetical protein [Aidingimonas halophila]|uniref:Uncharacterized protein n=1 Tax=Aidingimonas halophila TaxID=574349 RepID=A0A1H3FJU0_9GAMM|nr:hypothetical protein [Aidingimonas halophila]GHC37669.1 hypothetical protein GCM10008094_33680 [Aidingimonas halophila]SDX91373.1 hypothetical protein SAMN05443545_10860 [Aidingimonas halophila]